jgi:hypothetical protein
MVKVGASLLASITLCDGPFVYRVRKRHQLQRLIRPTALATVAARSGAVRIYEDHVETAVATPTLTVPQVPPADHTWPTSSALALRNPFASQSVTSVEQWLARLGTLFGDSTAPHSNC